MRVVSMILGLVVAMAMPLSAEVVDFDFALPDVMVLEAVDADVAVHFAVAAANLYTLECHTTFCAAVEPANRVDKTPSVVAFVNVDSSSIEQCTPRQMVHESKRACGMLDPLRFRSASFVLIDC